MLPGWLTIGPHWTRRSRHVCIPSLPAAAPVRSDVDMASATHIRLKGLWQHRLLGVLWFVVGIALVRWFFTGNFWWHDSLPYLPFVAGFACMILAAGLFARRFWARVCVMPVAAVIGLAAYDLLLVSLFESPQDLWAAIAGVTLAAYTLIFTVVSRLSHRKGEHVVS